MHDPLETLIKLRKRACDDAQRMLVDALASEDQAAQISHRIERKIAEETEAATDVAGTDAMVEAFIAWLPAARRDLAQARQVLSDRQAETVRSRAELTVCRTALETVETLVARRRDVARHRIDALHARELEDRPARPADGDTSPVTDHSSF